MIFICLKGCLIMEENNRLFNNIGRWCTDIRRQCVLSFLGALLGFKKPRETILRRNLVRYSTTSLRSCPSTKVPFFLDTTSNPSLCIHFLPVSMEILRGNPGSSVSLGRRTSFTQSQNWRAVRFGRPFTSALSRIYFVAFLFRSSRAFAKKWALHSRIVLSDLFIMAEASSAALVSPMLRCLASWKERKRPRETKLSRSRCEIQFSQKCYTI